MTEISQISRRIHLKEIDSTNTYVKKLIERGEDLPELTVVDTENQTAGRGQRGNSWETERGKNIMFSLVCHPDTIHPARQFILSQCIALAIQQTLSHYTEDVTVKWPNDIYCGDRKISGTLIECDLQGKHIRNCIIGSGININQRRFLSDAPNPVSLSMITGKTYTTDTILEEVLARFISYYDAVKGGREEEIIDAYMRHLYRREGMHPYQDANGCFSAEIASIEPSGHLVLRTSDNELRRYEFKEVKFLI